MDQALMLEPGRFAAVLCWAHAQAGDNSLAGRAVRTASEEL